ncbi:BPTI/Kunitz domain-containing protein-like [Babylonia areolata]|uniref:BPTI/Kunitz domain-containing protein-like n=1 Tax=Babylonia areolata TaxID=304850 RepID=UPI003FD07B13
MSQAVFALCLLIIAGTVPFIRGQGDRCSLPMRVGRCRAAHRRWYFNANSRQCRVFIYGGCDGNANNFHTREDCENTCRPSPCSLPKAPGFCRAFIPSFFYNARTGQCENFIYGGCNGNANRFPTRSLCEKKCVCTQPKDSGLCRAAFSRWYYDRSYRRCQTFTYGGCGGNGNNFQTEAACQRMCSE